MRVPEFKNERELKDLSNFTTMIPDYVKLKNIKPVLSGYISSSANLIERGPFPDDEAIHDIRVFMKKARATMKLLRNQVAEEDFNREYQSFRQAGKLLATWRDGSVHRKTLKSIRKNHPKLFASLSANEKISKLLAKTAEPAGNDDMGESVKELLKKSTFRMRFYTLDKLDPQLLLKDLDTSYKIAAEAYLECRNNMKVGKIHEFRKRSKDFLYQLLYFRPLNPGAIKNLEKRLELIASGLGKFNDLSQLLAAIGYKYDNPDNSPELNELAVLLRGMQDKCLSKVWALSYRIFCPGQKLLNVLGFRFLVI